ncbi:MAG: hypothetical protein ABIH23_32340 [bacterium]
MELNDLPDKLFVPVKKDAQDEVGLHLYRLDSGAIVLFTWSTDTPLRMWALDRGYEVEPIQFGKNYLIASALSEHCDYFAYNVEIGERSIPPERFINLGSIRNELHEDHAKRIQFYQSWLREAKELFNKVKVLYRQEGRLTVPLNLELIELMGVSKMAGHLYDSIDEPNEEEELIFEKIEEIVDKSMVFYKEIKPQL